jgi:hypothetical protein
MKIRNVSGDDRDVTPADGSPPFTVEAGHVVEVDDALGANMLEQEDVWRAADTTSVPDGTAAQVSGVGGRQPRPGRGGVGGRERARQAAYHRPRFLGRDHQP